MMRHSPRHSSSPSRTARTEPPSASLWSAIRKGCYPHQLSWLIDNPLRRLIIRPETLADRLPLTPSSRSLELGPGSGYFSAELARRIPAGRLELLDLQPQMLAKARRRLDRLACSNVGYAAADACGQLPYEEANFDLVLLVTVIGELSDPGTALAGLQRVLRSGGTLAVHEHLPDPDFVGFARLRRIVEAQGFRFMRRWGRGWNFTASFERP